MAQPIIVDLRNIYRSEDMRRAKFRYVGVGSAEMAAGKRGRDLRTRRPPTVHDRLESVDQTVEPVT
jgi:hypothetical protein